MTVQSGPGRAVRPVRLRNERRWESKTRSRTEPRQTEWTTAAATKAESGGGGGIKVGGFVEADKMEIDVCRGKKTGRLKRSAENNQKNVEKCKFILRMQGLINTKCKSKTKY